MTITTLAKGEDPAEAPAEAKTLPVYKARLGALKLAVWSHEHFDEKGNRMIFHNATLERGYRDKDGEWQDAKIQLNARDFGEVIALLQGGQQFLIKVG